MSKWIVIFVQEMVMNGEIQTFAIKIEHQHADLFTKVLGPKRFWFLRRKLGVRDLHNPS